MAKITTGQAPAKKDSAAKKLKLTWRQEQFLWHYMRNGGKGAAAAIKAGYSAHTARIQASDLLTRPHIRAALEAKQEAQRSRTQLKLDDVVDELLIQAMGDPRSLLDDAGKKIKNLAEVGENTKLITAYSFSSSDGPKGTSESFSVKFSDRNKALNDLTRILGLDKGAGERDRGSALERLHGAIERLGKSRTKGSG